MGTVLLWLSTNRSKVSGGYVAMASHRWQSSGGNSKECMADLSGLCLIPQLENGVSKFGHGDLNDNFKHFVCTSGES